MLSALFGKKKAAPAAALPVAAAAEWYSFDRPPQGDDLKSLLGGKGAGLVEMRKLGIPVPPGFTIPTTVCLSFLESGWTDAMSQAVREGLASLENTLGRRLGDADAPLLVSVRSGAVFSMPGMMDTVLNAGMTVDAARGFAQKTGDAQFAWDTYARAITSFAQVVLGADHNELAALQNKTAGVTPEAGAVAYAKAVASAGYEVPSDPLDQIMAAVKAVFESWHSARAKAYRDKQGIDHTLGTAANIQAMVFGNMGDTSGTGVAFSRDPSTGVYGLTGDFLIGAQGEDVVAGTHNTMPLAEMAERWPMLWDELCKVSDQLEQQIRDMVDLEFTVEDGKLWLLQTRAAKRSPRATFRAAVDMAEHPTFPVDRSEAIARCQELLTDPPMQTETATGDDDLVVLGKGLAASPGLAVGVLSLDPDDAVARLENGEKVILAREETSPNDIHGMGASVGLVTTLGGMVSHAAVVARAWGLAAAVGCDGIRFENGKLISGDTVVEPGTVISVCGETGRVFLGEKKGGKTPLPEVETIQSWAREADATETSDAGGDVDPIDCLRAIALKGMTNATSLTEVLDAGAEAIEPQINALCAGGLLEALKGGRVRLSEDGKAKIAELLTADQAAGKAVCDEQLHPFHPPNIALKEIVTAWQVREVDGEQQPNDHTDEAYDAAVIERLKAEVHAPIYPIMQVLEGPLPRLSRYLTRLEVALAKLEAGDGRYMAHPLLDSYHTVWFELHEELIHISGRNRKAETEAGRA